MLKELWAEAQGDKSLEVNEQDFGGIRYGGYGISGSRIVLGGRLVTLSKRNWQSRGMVRGFWKMPEKKPVIRYVHVFVGVEVTPGKLRGSGWERSKLRSS